MRILVVVVLLLVPAATVEAKTAVEGRWILRLERPSMEPDISEGVLRILGLGGRWSGTLQFPRLLMARKHDLVDVAGTGSTIRFTLSIPGHRLVFDGKYDARLKGLRGTCQWGRSTYAWTAKHAARRFDPGLRFDKALPRADPKEVGLDARALDDLIRHAFAYRTDALVILKDGKTVCERHRHGRARTIHTMSVTKFVTAMAIAWLLHEKRIKSVDEPVSTWFPEFKEGRKARVTLRHLLEHTSGIDREGSTQALNKADDKVAHVLGLGLVEEPGSTWHYNNQAVALLTGVIRKAARMSVDAYLERRLFKPLGIRDYTWNRDKAGNALTYAELKMHARDLAKIGQLIVDGGRWRKRKVFPEGMIAVLATPSKQQSDCGLLWRLRDEPPAIYHTGWLGQWLIVDRARRLVAVRLREQDRYAQDASLELGVLFRHLDALFPSEGD